MYEIRPVRRSQEGYMFGCALASMLGFVATIGVFFFLITMLALWIKAQPSAPTIVEITITSTPQVQPNNGKVAMVVPTDILVMTNTPLPVVVPSNIPLPSDTPSATITPMVLQSSEEFVSGGLGLSRGKWEELFTETGKGSLGYDPVMGIAYAGKYNVIFMEDNVWDIDRGWASNNFATLQDVEAESKILIPLDSQFIKRYSPEGRPETLVDVYKSESLQKRFSPEHWAFAEPGIFIILYNVYDTGVGKMIIAIGDNP